MTETQPNNWRAEADARNAAIDAKLAELGLTLAADFVPASTFKNDEWKRDAVNFTVTIKRGEREVWTGDYGYGVGHLPGCQRESLSAIGRESLQTAREAGVWGGDRFRPNTVPAPLLRDVMSALLSDASAIDHGDFESWASNLGYDTDSRKAETTYRACVDIGLKLRASLGDAVLTELGELYQDY